MITNGRACSLHRIEGEWIKSLEKQRPDLVGKLEVRRDCMREAVPDWEVPEAAWSAITVFKWMRARRKKPKSDPEDFAYALEVGGLPMTAERLRLAADLI